MNAKQTALDAYLARTAAIHAKLEQLQQLADDHFGHDPDAINLGHVGDLGRAEAGLDELLPIVEAERILNTWGSIFARPQQSRGEAAHDLRTNGE